MQSHIYLDCGASWGERREREANSLVVVAFLDLLEIEEVEDGNVRLCHCFDALLRKLHPTVRKGVLLGVTVDLDLGWVRVH